MTNPQSSIAVFAGALLFALSASVSASDRKIHMGTMCQPLSPNYASQLTYFSDNIFNNSSTSYAYISCPIVRDNTQNTNGTRLAYVRVQSNAARSLSCGLHSRSSTGGFVAYRSAATTSSSVTSLNVDVSASSILGTYSIFCSVPPGGRVYSYDIDEF